MTISHINGIALTTLSHINGIVKANVSAKNGQTLAAGTEGVPAPTLDGSPTLLASWDFDAASTVTLSGADIDQIAGADGTSYTLLTPGNMPAQGTAGDGKKTGSFVLGSSEYMQIASALGVNTANGATIIMVCAMGATGTQVLADLADGAGGGGANRWDIYYNSTGNGYYIRKADPTTSYDASELTSVTTSRVIVVARFTGGAGATAKINYGGRSAGVVTGTANGVPTGLSHFTLGARRQGNAQATYATVDIDRVLVYAGVISDTATEEAATWANTNYGTANAA